MYCTKHWKWSWPFTVVWLMSVWKQADILIYMYVKHPNSVFHMHIRSGNIPQLPKSPQVTPVNVWCHQSGLYSYWMSAAPERVWHWVRRLSTRYSFLVATEGWKLTAFPEIRERNPSLKAALHNGSPCPLQENCSFSFLLLTLAL